MAIARASLPRRILAAVSSGAPKVHARPHALALQRGATIADKLVVSTRRAPREEDIPSYFHTYEQMKAAMVALHKRFPDLVQIVDIGDSYEKTTGKADRDILVLKLTSKAGPAKKPSAFYFGGQHAREIAPPEMLMRFATWLLEGYGKDAEATALLDSREIHLLPMFNPDGHAVVERGFADQPGGKLTQRKTTSGTYGTDTNRNWESANWGTAGAVQDEISDSYPGPKPGSEVEVQAAEAYIGKIMPGVSVDWHAAGRLVLFPPEDDKGNVTPDQPHFERIGQKLAKMNGYAAKPIVDLYPTSGSGIWPHEKYGIGTFALEVGAEVYPETPEFEQTCRENLPVMIYGAKIADDWRKTSAGPDVTLATADTNGNVTAKAADVLTSKSAVAMEVLFDPTTPAGKGVQLAAGRDGAFSANVDAAQIAGDKRLAYVRGKGADGIWGPLTGVWITKPVMNVVALRAVNNRRPLKQSLT